MVNPLIALGGIFYVSTNTSKKTPQEIKCNQKATRKKKWAYKPKNTTQAKSE